MALYEKKWWQKLFQKKVPEEKFDALNNIQSVSEFLEELGPTLEQLKEDLDKLEELEKEREVGTSGILQINLETQAQLMDKILEKYQIFQDDADINGIRIKQIARNLLEKAEEIGMKDLVKERKKNFSWKFAW